MAKHLNFRVKETKNCVSLLSNALLPQRVHKRGWEGGRRANGCKSVKNGKTTKIEEKKQNK